MNKINNMNETLTVVKPYCWMEKDDTFQLSADGSSYVSTRTREYTNTYKDIDLTGRSEMTCSISKETANNMINAGILKAGEEETPFVNVFDRIDEMLDTYNKDLDNIDTDMKDSPTCMKIEKETVLRNLIKTLSYLRSLKK